MKVLGISAIDKRSKVTIYGETYTEIPIELVIKNFVVNWGSQSDTYNPVELNPIRLKDIPHEIKGIVTYESLQEFLNFLIDDYIVGDKFFVDHLLKKIEGMSRSQKKKFLLDTFVNELIDSDGYKYFKGTRNKRGRSEEIKTKIDFAMSEKELFGAGERIITLNLPQKTVYLTKSYERQLEIYAEQPLRTQKKEITKYVFLTINRSDSRICFFWDSKVLKNLFIEENIDKESLTKFLGVEMYELLNKNGCSVELLEDKEIVPPTDFIPEFLLRVPAFNELKKEDIPKKDILPEKLKKPMFLFDARGAIKFDNTIEIIDSLDIALYILSRSPKWIFLPDDYANIDTVKKYSEEKEYYIACGGF